MEETPMARKRVTSSVKEISMEQLGNRVMVRLPLPLSAAGFWTDI
jgi:hypothetical protein